MQLVVWQEGHPACTNLLQQFPFGNSLSWSNFWKLDQLNKNSIVAVYYFKYSTGYLNKTSADVSIECRYDMQLSIQLLSALGIDSKLGLTMG